MKTKPKQPKPPVGWTRSEINAIIQRQKKKLQPHAKIEIEKALRIDGVLIPVPNELVPQIKKAVAKYIGKETKKSARSLKKS